MIYGSSSSGGLDASRMTGSSKDLADRFWRAIFAVLIRESGV
jgi:hypothetical protein